MLVIEFIAFARYPPMSETSHDGGLVDMIFEAQKSRVLCCVVNQGDTLKETRD
jgi:hypothetical protein